MKAYARCNPDAQNRKNSWYADLYSAGSFADGVYTPGTKIDTIQSDSILSVTTVEEAADKARTQTTIKSVGMDIPEFAYAMVYAASYEPPSLPTPYYLHARQRLYTRSVDHTTGITKTVLQTGLADLDDLIIEALGRHGFSPYLDAVYDEGEGDYTYDYGRRFTIPHLLKALMYMTGLYPCCSAVVSDGVLAYNSAHQSTGFYYRDDGESLSWLRNGGLSGWIAQFNNGRSDGASSEAPKLYSRQTREGDRLFYLLSEEPSATSRTYTMDDYTDIISKDDSTYGETLQLSTRGDIRHELEDVVEVTDFGRSRIKRLSLSYNGTLSGKLVMTRLERMIMTAEGVPPLMITGSAGGAFVDYRIYGNSTQYASPTPDAPQYIQSVGTYTLDTRYWAAVDMGSLNWTQGNGASGVFYCEPFDLKKASSVDNQKIGVECDGYSASTSTSTSTMGDRSWLRNSASSRIHFRDTRYETAAEFKSAVSGIMMYYITTAAPSDETQSHSYKLSLASFDNAPTPLVEPTITDIWLDEPLRKVGDFCDELDFANKKIVRNIYETSNYTMTRVYRKLTKVCRFACTSIVQPSLKEIYDVKCALLNYKSGFSTDEETVFHHSSTTPTHSSQTFYMSFLWGRLGLTYDGTNVKKDGVALTDAQIVETVNAYLASIPEKDRRIQFILADPTEESFDAPAASSVPGDSMLAVISNANASNLYVKYMGA